jgi:hypothetical protein
MKMKKWFLAAALLVICACSALHAQRAPYTFGIGARAGLYLGLTGKYNFDGHSAIEVIGETRRKGVLVTGLYEYHFTLDGIDDALRLYLGAGGHVAYLSSAYINTIPGAPVRRDGLALGLDAIVGLEYTFPAIPINISIDYKPAFHYWDRLRVATDNVGLAIRYVFE